MEVGSDTRPPWGALAVVAVGLMATVAAALLSTDKPIGAADLAWEAKAPMPDSKAAPIPGNGEIRISEAGIRATGPNVSGYRLFRVTSVLTIDPGSAISHGHLQCAVRVPSIRTIVARTPENRTSYPLPSSEEDLEKQQVPKTVTVEFTSHSSDLARVELGDALEAFTNQAGVLVDWAPFHFGQQVWEWSVPGTLSAKPLKLAFASIWRTTSTPAARISCTAGTAAGSGTVQTAGAISGLNH
jgi:hypothetical protein